MPIDDWKQLVDVAGLAMLLLAVLLGVASWRIGVAISRRDAGNLAMMGQRTAQLQTAVTDAQNAQQRVELRLSEQQERAATAERDLSTIQRVVRPRSIPSTIFDDPTVRAKYAALSEFKGKRVVFFVTDDVEAQLFSAQLWQTLKTAKWQPGTTNLVWSQPGVGVYSGVAPDSPDWRAGAAVADLINAVFKKLEIGGVPVANMPEERLPAPHLYPHPPGAMVITIGQRDVESQLRAAPK